MSNHVQSAIYNKSTQKSLNSLSVPKNKKVKVTDIEKLIKLIKNS